jgi:hypothetical protein
MRRAGSQVDSHVPCLSVGFMYHLFGTTWKPALQSILSCASRS